VGRMLAETQAARAAAVAVRAGDSGAFAALADSEQALADYSRRAANGELGAEARALAANADWRAIEAGVVALAGSRDALATAYAALDRLLEIAPTLLAAIGNVVSALPAADLERSEPYLVRVELTVEALQHDARGLAGVEAVDRVLQRLAAAE